MVATAVSKVSAIKEERPAIGDEVVFHSLFTNGFINFWKIRAVEHGGFVDVNNHILPLFSRSLLDR